MSDLTPKQCRTYANSTEVIWRGQPGWSEENNMAKEWRRAADTIERLQSSSAAHQKLLDAAARLLNCVESGEMALPFAIEQMREALAAFPEEKPYA
jgi:hypothetical protein